MVAAELWLLVCTFPLQRRKVISNLMWDLRANVLAVQGWIGAAFLLFILMVATTSGLLWFARRKGIE